MDFSELTREQKQKNMAGIELILSDIDGTILPYNKSVLSDRVLGSFRAALDAGIHIGPATGRGAHRVLPVFKDDKRLCATMLATNGMQVYLDGELICEKHIELEPLSQCVNRIRELEGVGLCYFEGATPIIVYGEQDILRTVFPAYGKAAQISHALPDKPPIKVNIFVRGDFKRTTEVMKILQNDISGIDFNVPMTGFLNLTPPGWSKASGIDVLCNQLNIGLNQVCVCGDSDNDLEMLRHVPFSVAVAEATQNARATAHYCIGSVEKEAVADLIDDIVLLRS